MSETNSVMLEAKKLVWEEEQEKLKQKMILEDMADFANINLLGGVDISFIKDTNDACATLVVLDSTSLNVLYSDFDKVTMDEPYIPGFLAFREVSHLVKLFRRLEQKIKDGQVNIALPDVILVDGNGLLHPKGFGLACHLGVLLDCPTIGIGKNLFFVDGLTQERVNQSLESVTRDDDGFCSANLEGDSGAFWAAAVIPNKNNTKPIFVSQGHKISLPTSVQIVKACSTFRIPEPVRQADLLSREWLRNNPN